MKKQYFISLLNVLLVLSFVTRSMGQNIPLINSNIKRIEYKIEDNSPQAWNISPELKPDRLTVACKNEKNLVKFITDVDSIEFTVSEGDTIQFYILFEKEKALTEIVGTPKNVHFTDDYIQKNKGKFIVEIPEVSELANIMVAISDIGQLDSNMVDMTTDYRQKVMKHFLPFKNHPAIVEVNEHITGVMDLPSYWYYYALKINACGYLMDEEGQILDDGIITTMAPSEWENVFMTKRELIEDFAKKSDFITFYNENRPYYNQLLKTYRRLNPIDKMQRWLENKFDIKYGSYRVVFSPLVGGAHATQKYADNGFEQTLMFICRSEFDSEDSEALNEMNSTRVVFTEIDHNFVNPYSDKYKAQIDKVFAEMDKWSNPDNPNSKGYKTPYTVFNEYMTWAVFSLYCYDNFQEEEATKAIGYMENTMEKGRGFTYFRDFNQKLIELYKANPNDMDKLFTDILKWANGHSS